MGLCQKILQHWATTTNIIATSWLASATAWSRLGPIQQIYNYVWLAINNCIQRMNDNRKFRAIAVQCSVSSPFKLVVEANFTKPFSVVWACHHIQTQQALLPPPTFAGMAQAQSIVASCMGINQFFKHFLNHILKITYSPVTEYKIISVTNSTNKFCT